jgi:methionyl-tRNA formyltransferase
VKIEFLTTDDSRYILPFFDEFVRCYASEFQVAQVSLFRAMGSRSRTKLAKELFWLYGAFGLLRLGSGVVLDRCMGKFPASRDAKQYHSIAQLCRAYGICCQRSENPNDTTFLEGVRQRGCEIVVSVACPYILKEPLLELPERGCINIHHAPLPRYKGMMPTFWQMYHGEKSVGVTVHFMEAKIDAGSILLSEQLEIEPGESLDHLIRRSKRHGAHAMAKALRKVASGNPVLTTPDNSTSSYFTFPTREEIRKFHRRGWRAI